MEGSPVDGNIIHAYELATVTTDHDVLKSVPGRIDLEPSDIQLLHAERNLVLNSIPGHESAIRENVTRSGGVSSRRSSLRNVKKAFLLPSSGIPRISHNARSVAVVHHNDDLTCGHDPSTRVADTADRSCQER